MIWLNLLGSAFKTGATLYENRQKEKQAISQARLLHAEKMARGEIELRNEVFQTQKNDWKDEFILLILSSPLFLLAYSVFAEDEEISKKLDLYFDKLQNMPWWMIGLWVTVVGAVYGIKATEIKNLGIGKK